MLYVWNGKEANPIVKASAISKASELNSRCMVGKDHVLKVLFSGGVIRDKKLQRGSVYTFSEVIQRDDSRAPSSEEEQQSFETISLLKWLIRPDVVRQQTLRIKILSNYDSSA